MDDRPASFGDNRNSLTFVARLPGEMARRVIEKDWSQTPLGPAAGWPDSLRLAVETVLACGFPMAVRWGPQLISIYNDGYAALLGPRHPAALGAPIEEVWPEIAGELGALNLAILRGERPAFFEKMHLWRVQRHGAPEDARFTASYSPIPEPSAPNGIGGILVATLETTAEYRTDRQLRHLTQKLEDEVLQRTRERDDQVWQLSDSERDFRTLVDAVTDYAIFRLTPDGTVASWNAGAERAKGYLAHEIIGENFRRFYTPEDQADGLPERALAQAAREGRVEIEGWRVRKDGTRFWANVVMDAIYDDDGQLSGFAKITRDITERREAQVVLERTQEQLAQAHKMEALGQLTGGIAHDFNNMLMVVGGYSQFLKQRLSEPKDKRAIDAIEFATSRAESLTRQLLTFSRRQSLNRTTVRLADCFAGFREILATTAKGNVNLDIAIADGIWPVTIDVNEFEIAIINLIVNARDAMPKGGRLRIAARNETMDGHNPAEPLRGEFVAIEVIDEGVGIAPEIVSKVFDPFFTTKGMNQGTGLGLSQVYGFAHQAGGTVRVASEVGVGTRVTLYLPRAREAVTGAAEEHGAGPVGGHETVLLVEDHAEVQAIAATMLEELGYTVITADSATQALDVLDGDDGVDLVLSDIVMPGSLDGIGLAQRVGKDHPGVKVLLTTGYSKEASDPHSPFPVLRKPYQLPAMARAVRHVLDHG